jgi:hypothetical protein
MPSYWSSLDLIDYIYFYLIFFLFALIINYLFIDSLNNRCIILEPTSNQAFLVPHKPSSTLKRNSIPHLPFGNHLLIYLDYITLAGPSRLWSPPIIQGSATHLNSRNTHYKQDYPPRNHHHIPHHLIGRHKIYKLYVKNLNSILNCGSRSAKKKTRKSSVKKLSSHLWTKKLKASQKHPKAPSSPFQPTPPSARSKHLIVSL